VPQTTHLQLLLLLLLLPRCMIKQAAPALLPKSQGTPEGLPQLTQLACAFGNTVTLPLMYLMTLLPIIKVCLLRSMHTKQAYPKQLPRLLLLLLLLLLPRRLIAQAAPALLPKSQGTPEGLLQLTQLACAFSNTHIFPNEGIPKPLSCNCCCCCYNQAASALLPKSQGTPEGLPQLTQLACAFGNTVTLPLMYLMTMLPAADASRATGFMSLFHAAWSPCLWVFGYRSIQGTGKPKGRRRGKTGACRHRVHVAVPCSVVAVPVGVWL
jgi:hypothetical protein